MATRDTGQPTSGITRRDFLKTSAAATAVIGCGLDFAYDPEKASAYESSTDYDVTFTTCPYCSASCGQRVVTRKSDQMIVDIYGDFESPINQGGLCAKGAGAAQLVNNPYRIGAWAAADEQLAYTGNGHTPGTHPVNDVFLSDGTGAAVAYKRKGNEPWAKMTLSAALAEIGPKLVEYRGALDPATYQSLGVAFFGCSHMNNEPNYLYRKTIAMFGTSNVEHQARI